jgi:tetratricopeptide (TPR) repeat protein
MKIVENLSALALRQLADGNAPGAEGVALVRSQFSTHPEKLRQALARAVDQGWKALEIALGGRPWWDGARSRLSPGEDATIGNKLTVFFDAAPLGDWTVPDPELRKNTLRDLRTARHGHLLGGELDRSGELTWLDAAFESGPEGEWELVDQIADELRQALPALSEFLTLRRDGPSPLVSGVRLFFRRAVAVEPELANAGPFAALPALTTPERTAADGLADLFSHHATRLDELLALATGDDDIERVLDIEAETRSAADPMPTVGKAINSALRRYGVSRQMRPVDFTTMTEPERQRVKELATRAHSLGLEGNGRWPATLHGIGVLQAAAGLLEGAQRDLQAALAATTDSHAQAVISHTAYRVALEQHNLPAALPLLQKAVTLDGKRLSPFPADKFEVEKILGTEPSGVALLCKHRTSGMRGVVKTLMPEALGVDVAELFRETRLLESLDNPALVRVRDCDYADDTKQRPFMVTDYFDGGTTLSEYVRQHGPIAPGEFLKIARVLSELLAAAHERGVLHRDIKPTSLLVRREGNAWKIKLINFGMACRPVLLFLTLAGPPAWAKTTLGASTLATLPYLSPEQLHMLEGAAPGPHSDVYSFGRLCYFALLGTPEPDDEQKGALPGGWRKLLGHCTSRNLTRRLPNFQAIIKRLSQVPTDVDTGPGAGAKTADPEMVQNLLNRGMALKQQGNSDRALAAFTKALQLDPQLIAGYFKRGNTYLDRGEFEQAITDYTAAIRLDPGNAAAWMNRGLAHFKKGDFEAVIGDCSEAVKVDPKLAQAYSIRAAAFWERGERHRAIADYNLALRSDPKNALAYNGRGLAFFEEGNHDQAIADYTQALKLEPRLLVGYLNRGNAFRIKGANTEAIADLTKALRIDPKNTTAYFYRALALMGKGLYDQAINDLGKVLQLDPKYPEAAAKRDEAYRLRAKAATPPPTPPGGIPKPVMPPTPPAGTPKPVMPPTPPGGTAKPPSGVGIGGKAPAPSARRKTPMPLPAAPAATKPAKNPAAQQEEERRQMRAAAYFTSGKSAYDAEDYPQAIEQFTKAAAVDPQDPQIFYQRGLAHVAQDDFHEALSDFTQSLKINPRNAMAHYQRGLTHRLLGQHDQAIEDYSRALKLDPRLALAYRSRSLAYQAKGDSEKARADHERAVKLDPSLARDE